MNKVKLLSFISISLLVINIVLLILLSKKKHTQHPEGGPRKIIIERLNFKDAQIILYDSLIHQHRKSRYKIETKLMELKNLWYTTLTLENSQKTKDSLALEVSKIQTQMESINYKHFEDIKKICRPNQLKAYKNLTSEIAQLFGPPHKFRKN